MITNMLYPNTYTSTSLHTCLIHSVWHMNNFVEILGNSQKKRRCCAYFFFLSFVRSFVNSLFLVFFFFELNKLRA